jgi:hypothetical protein
MSSCRDGEYFCNLRRYFAMFEAISQDAQDECFDFGHGFLARRAIGESTGNGFPRS